MADAVFLISAPRSLAHEFRGARVKIAQMDSAAAGASRFLHPGPFEHHFYALSVPTSPMDESGMFGNEVEPGHLVALLTLFFGRRIQNHGQIRWQEIYAMPDMEGVRPNQYYGLPIYSAAHDGKLPDRPDGWPALQSVASVVDRPMAASGALVRAAQAFAQSLTVFPLDRELGYFKLIQALETIVPRADRADGSLYSHDQELMQHLEWLDQLGEPQGSRTARFIRGRLYQTKRAVWLWVRERVSAEFFSGEATALTADSLQQRLSAAYDLRSAYVHSGVHFGDWIDPVDGRCGVAETVPLEFSRICLDLDLRKLLERCPTYLGLERLVRYLLCEELTRAERDAVHPCGTR